VREPKIKDEKLRLLIALRSRSACDSKGYFDYDVAEWFDPGQPYEKLPSGEETPRQYYRKLRPFVKATESQ
jgi:hypothetical protein